MQKSQPFPCESGPALRRLSSVAEKLVGRTHRSGLVKVKAEAVAVTAYGSPEAVSHVNRNLTVIKTALGIVNAHQFFVINAVRYANLARIYSVVRVKGSLNLS